MAFLRNAWYCAGWSDELTDQPIGRTFLGEPVVMYRRTDGSAVAVGGRCPHRFAPLAMGKVVGDCIECPYHGLRFDPSGACNHNPHGDGAIPKAASVPAYLLAERDGILWIWMGDAALADPQSIPDMHEVAERPGWHTIRGYLGVGAHYELLTDNLMDLSHVPFLHPFLSNGAPLPPEFEEVRSLKQEGEAVYSMHLTKHLPMTPLFALLWGDAPPAYGDLRANMRWEAPANLLLDVGMTPPGQPPAAGPSLPIAHLLTPENENSTHYFWVQARDRKIDDLQLDPALHAGITDVFKNEDERMIVACADMMGTNDLFSLRPVLLPGDGPAVRARRLLSARIDKEQAGR
jgi:vanillate O-demethylase monooxygenase subunit